MVCLVCYAKVEFLELHSRNKIFSILKIAKLVLANLTLKIEKTTELKIAIEQIFIEIVY